METVLQNIFGILLGFGVAALFTETFLGSGYILRGPDSNEVRKLVFYCPKLEYCYRMVPYVVIGRGRHI